MIFLQRFIKNLGLNFGGKFFAAKIQIQCGRRFRIFGTMKPLFLASIFSSLVRKKLDFGFSG